MKIALAQINPTVGDFEGNCTKICSAIGRAKAENASLVVLPELAICGYPPHDMLENRPFIERCTDRIQQIATRCVGITAIVGSPTINPSSKGKMLFNSAYVLSEGKIQSIHHKSLIPTYDIFDEYRYFEPNTDTYSLTTIGGLKVAITICEDLWDDQPVTASFGKAHLYRQSPMERLAALKPDLIINIAASPFNFDSEQRRISVFRNNVERYALPVVYVNQVGGNTELLFDGGSMVLNAKGEVQHLLNSFEEDFATIDTDSLNNKPIEISPSDNQRIARIHDALVMGISDYFRKMGFKKAAVGLSGGIDSALVLTLLHEALGNQNIHALLMPSQYSSQHSIDDAVALAKNLNVEYDIVPIQPMFDTFREQLKPVFRDKPQEDVTEENIQARIRGILLMALSNKYGNLILNTTNKSEAAVGYGTLYGDMNGAFSVLGDVYKTDVFKLAKYINRNGEVIPNNTITKPPSAELRPDQKDSDSLPPYDILDQILYAYIEQQLNTSQIEALGFDPAIVQKTVRLVNINEYKRFQAPPIIRVSSKAFGPGRKMPIVAKWEQEK